MSTELDVIELIRTRAGSFAGSGAAGLHHLASRALETFGSLTPATRLDLHLGADGTLAIRGATGRYDFERAANVLGRAMKEPWNPIDYLMVVACLCETFVLGGTKAPKPWAARKGRPSADVTVPAPAAEVELHLKPEPELFGGARFDFDHLSAVLRLRAALSPQLPVRLQDDEGRVLTLRFPQGLVNLVREEAGFNVDLATPLALDFAIDQLRVRLALQWMKPSERAAVLPRIWSAFNGNPTRGGAHHRGLLRAVGKWKRPAGTSNDGLVAAVAVDGWGGRLEGEYRDVWECDGFEEQLATRVIEALRER